MNSSKFKNFLYYNKFKLIVAVIFIIAVIFSISQCSQKVEYDFGVLYIAETERADEAKFKTALVNAGVAEDIDSKDGLNILLKTIYVPQSAGVMHQQRVPEQIRVELISGECSLYIVDEETLYENEVFDIFFDLSEMADKYGVPAEKRYLGENGKVCAIALSGNSFLTENGAPCDSLYLAVKNHEPDDADGKIRNAVAMAEYILTN